MDYVVATEKAVRFLTASLKTEKEVRDKLISLKCDEEVVMQVINHLKDISYINDREYVEAYIRQESKMQKYSIFEIVNKLKAKGINEELLDYVASVLNDMEYEKEVIRKIRLKKEKLGEEEIKIKSYLYRRGFKGGSYE